VGGVATTEKNQWLQTFNPQDQQRRRDAITRHAKIAKQNKQKSSLASSARGAWLQQKSCQGFSRSGGAREAGVPEADQTQARRKGRDVLTKLNLLFFSTKRGIFLVSLRYLIVVPRPLPAAPLAMRRTYLIVVLRQVLKPLPAAMRRYRIRR
jgi:hypothetical protein